MGPTAGINTQSGPHFPTPGEEKVVTFDGEEEIIDEAGNVTKRTHPIIDNFGDELGPTEGRGEGPPPSSPPDPEPESVWEKSWARAYDKCNTWKDIWGATQDVKNKWPSKVNIFGDTMYRQEKTLCTDRFSAFRN